MMTRFEIEKVLKPLIDRVRTISGDSVEAFEPQKQTLIDFYSLSLEMAGKIHYRKLVEKAQAEDTRSPEEILQELIELPEDTSAPIAGRETIYMQAKFTPVLQTRTAATPLYEKLKTNIEGNVHTKLNFKGVLHTDASFIDEAIAKLIVKAGEKHFYSKVSIVYANKQVKDMIAYVVAERKKFYLA